LNLLDFEKAICSSTVGRYIGPRESMHMLKRCIIQKRHQESKSRTARSLFGPFQTPFQSPFQSFFQNPFDDFFTFQKQIMDQFKNSLNAQRHMTLMPMGNNGVIRITELDVKPETPNRINCEAEKLIRIESAVLNSVDFASKCQLNPQIKNENLDILNETCVDDGQALRVVSAS